MKLKNKFLISLFVLTATSQTFAMGAKPPTTTQTTPITSASTILTPLLGSLTPSIFPNAASATSSNNQLTNILLPILSTITQSSSTTATNAYTDQIKTLVMDSACSQISWKNAGTTSLNFMNGVAVNFAHNICQLKKPNSITGTLLNTVLGNALTKMQTSSLMGKITSSEFTNVPVCNQLLTDIQDMINSDQYACQDL
jgi:uncharacterized membrane protein YkvI